MINGKRYLIIKRQEINLHVIKLAYWFSERITKYHVYKEGFYTTRHRCFPHENIIEFRSLDKLPKFTEWKLEEPIEGEKYLAYRVGSTMHYPPHYTIRKYHNGSFGSKDVKYWIMLKDILEAFDEYGSND